MAKTVKNKAGKGVPKVSIDPKVREKCVIHSVKSSIHQAAKEFGVSVPSVTNWRKQMGVTKDTELVRGKLPEKPAQTDESEPTVAIYPESLRKAVVKYSVKHGVHGAAETFDVSPASVTNWRRELGVTRADKANVENSQRPVTKAELQRLLTTAQKLSESLQDMVDRAT